IVRPRFPRRLPRLHVASGVLAAIVSFAVYCQHPPGADLELEGMLLPSHPSRPWALVQGKYWQIVAPETADPDATDAAEGTRGICLPGMIEVQGAMKIDGERGTVEALQDSTCAHWINRDFPARPQHFCLDRFEYPNRKGGFPVIAVNWHEAGSLCHDRGERLCSEDEWTFACEGEDALPYPTGYGRDEQACVIDRPWRLFDERLLAARDSALAIAEIDYVWQGEASGPRDAPGPTRGFFFSTGRPFAAAPAGPPPPPRPPPGAPPPWRRLPRRS